MRIRKRQVPLPLSSLIPVPLSDLYSNRSPAAAAQGFFNSTDGGGGDDGHRRSAPPQLPSDLSDRLIQGWGIDGCGFSDHGAHEDEKNLREKALGCEKVGDEEEEGGGSKKVDSSPETAVPRESNSLWRGLGRWSDHHEEGKIVPLKKRRVVSCDEGSVNAEMKTKMNKKCIGEMKKPEASRIGSTVSKGRKKARGGTVVEGSRCSRVNGRGWRCCQQTLVGYSLCEHHLGKGRLRSMSGNGKKGIGRNQEINTGSGGDEKIPAVVAAKKKVKLGMVKARSISSLLGQTSSNEIVAPADHHGDHGDK